MSVDNPTKTQLLITRIAVIAMIGLALVGLMLYGFSPAVNRRIWSDIFARPGGPMALRFALQPLMAFLAALHDGTKDARSGRSPYLWAMLTSRTERTSRFREGLNATSRIIVMGLVMDTIYQWVVFKTFYPGEAVILTILLAFVPYLLLRGAVARVARRFLSGSERSLKEARK